MNRLPDELLQSVLECVPKDDLLSVRLTSRALYSVATEVFFRKHTVYIQDRDDLRRLVKLMSTAPENAVPIQRLELYTSVWTPSPTATRVDVAWKMGMLLVGRAVPYLQRLTHLYLQPPQSFESNLNEQTWRVFKQLFQLPALLDLDILSVAHVLRCPLPSMLSRRLTTLHLDIIMPDQDLLIICQLLEHMTNLAILTVRVPSPMINKKPLSRFVHGQLRTKPQFLELRDLTILVGCHSYEEEQEIASLLSFLFYVTPRLDKLRVETGTYEDHRIPSLSRVMPPDPTRLPVRYFGFPRELVVVLHLGPISCVWEAPLRLDYRAHYPTRLPEKVVCVSPLPTALMLLMYLPTSNMTHVELQGGNESTALLSLALWPRVLNRIPTLETLKFTLVDLSEQGLALCETPEWHGSRDRVNHLSFMGCILDRPSTVTRVLRLCPSVQKLDILHCMCRSWQMDVPIHDNPWVASLRALFRSRRTNKYTFFWWHLPASQLHMHVSEQCPHLELPRLHIILQDTSHAIGQTTRIWLREVDGYDLVPSSQSSELPYHELSAQEVLYVRQYIDSHQAALKSPRVLFDNDSQLDPMELYDLAVFCLRHHLITVYTCNSLTFCHFIMDAKQNIAQLTM
ncbi:hypothetical protein BC940DRAFT_363302 [Gongronella butleri]|nr:hypothetical protein BC940DRAFT_363302 [Gongronella butleri]